MYFRRRNIIIFFTIESNGGKLEGRKGKQRERQLRHQNPKLESGLFDDLLRMFEMEVFLLSSVDYLFCINCSNVVMYTATTDRRNLSGEKSI